MSHHPILKFNILYLFYLFMYVTDFPIHGTTEQHNPIVVVPHQTIQDNEGLHSRNYERNYRPLPIPPPTDAPVQNPVSRSSHFSHPSCTVVHEKHLDTRIEEQKPIRNHPRNIEAVNSASSTNTDGINKWPGSVGATLPGRLPTSSTNNFRLLPRSTTERYEGLHMTNYERNYVPIPIRPPTNEPLPNPIVRSFSPMAFHDLSTRSDAPVSHSSHFSLLSSTTVHDETVITSLDPSSYHERSISSRLSSSDSTTIHDKQDTTIEEGTPINEASRSYPTITEANHVYYDTYCRIKSHLRHTYEIVRDLQPYKGYPYTVLWESDEHF